MMAGQQNHKIGAYDNASEFASTVPTFAHYLRSAGYQTSLVGKMHFVGPDQLHGYEERLTTDIYPADFGWTPDWLDPDGRFDWWFHNLDSVTHAGVADATNQLDYDDEVGFRTIRKLRDLARTQDERPFMVPRRSHIRTTPMSLAKSSGICTTMSISRCQLSARSLMMSSTRIASGYARSICADTTHVTDEQILAARRAYLANCSYVDHWVGQIVDTLNYHGLADDTIIVFTADHGDMLGERGLWYKMNFFEHSARIPLIVHSPTRFRASRVAPCRACSTVRRRCSTWLVSRRRAQWDGHSLLPQLGGFEDTLRTVEGEYLGEGAVAPIFMLRRGKTQIHLQPARR